MTCHDPQHHDLTKPAIRRALRQRLSDMSPADRQSRSTAACNLLGASPEFAGARVVMLYLAMPTEVETAPLVLKAWQLGMTVAVPKVSWDQRHMLPIEINSLHTGIATTGPGVREPIAGNPVPIDLIDLVIVPGLGFTPDGHRIGRGMGFYDRFLAQGGFTGISCGLAFEDQLVPTLPTADHDIPLHMLVTNTTIRRFNTAHTDA